MVAQHRRQSRAELEAQERAQFGDTHERPGKRLEAGDLSAHEFLVLRLRVRDSREVAVLASAVARVDCPLRGIVARLVKVVDHLNCIIAGVEVPDPWDALPGLDAPDFSGLTMTALQAKRATLCIGAKLAREEVMAGRMDDAEERVSSALCAAFGHQNVA